MNQELSNYIHRWRSTLSGSPWIDETFSKKLSLINEGLAFRRPHLGQIGLVLAILAG